MDVKERFDEDQNVWYITLDGEIDIYNAPELKDKIHKLIEQQQGDLILNCEGLSYIDSTGLGVLISSLKKIKKYGGDMRIVGIRPYIYKIFTITGLDKIFSIEVSKA